MLEIKTRGGKTTINIDNDDPQRKEILRAIAKVLKQNGRDEENAQVVAAVDIEIDPGG